MAASAPAREPASSSPPPLPTSGLRPPSPCWPRLAKEGEELLRPRTLCDLPGGHAEPSRSSSLTKVFRLATKGALDRDPRSFHLLRWRFDLTKRTVALVRGAHEDRRIAHGDTVREGVDDHHRLAHRASVPRGRSSRSSHSGGATLRPVLAAPVVRAWGSERARQNGSTASRSFWEDSSTSSRLSLLSSHFSACVRPTDAELARVDCRKEIGRDRIAHLVQPGVFHSVAVADDDDVGARFRAPRELREQGEVACVPEVAGVSESGQVALGSPPSPLAVPM